MNQLNPQQLAAVTSRHTRNVLICGPGSGKTTTLIARVRHLIEQGTDPEKIVMITFTNAAAKEMRDRLGQRIGFVGTLHSFLLRVLREYPGVCDMLGVPVSPSILDEAQADEIIESVRKDHRVKASMKECRGLIGTGPIIDGSLLDPVQLVRAEFFARMLKQGALTYDGILHYGLLVAQKAEEFQSMKFKDWHWSALLVDEAQDLSKLHWRIINAMPFGAVDVCGDPDQAIYGWNGGDVESLVKAQGNVICIEHNYRCRETICAAAQKLIEHNTNRMSKTTRRVHPEGTFETSLGHSDAASEARYIAMNVSLIGLGSTAVLCRTNNMVEFYAEALRYAGIPVAQQKRAAVPKDWQRTRQLVAFAANPENDHAAWQFIRETRGKAIGNAFRLVAMENFRSINSQHQLLDAALPIASIPQFAARCDATTETLAALDKCIALLPADASANDLLLAMNSHEWETEDAVEGTVVCTIHAAKGREWDTVFIPGVEEGILPSDRSGTDIEEERRLLYVGMTRARHRCVLSACKSRHKNSWERQPQPMQPSRFIKEMKGEI